MKNFNLNLNDTAVAFASKSNVELQKKRWLFSLMGSPFLAQLGAKSAEFGLSFGLPIKFAIKETVFRQFCGGETIEECEGVIRDLAKSKIGTILDYSIEGKDDEATFERTRAEILKVLRRAAGDANIPFAVFKVTGLARIELLEKISTNSKMDSAEQNEWRRARTRVEEICRTAYELDQPTFIDAEESWIQPAIDNLAREMMHAFNQEKAIIYNTIQLYRHDRLDFLQTAFEQAKSDDYFLGVKLVRGAYMEKERARAHEKGYRSPIQTDKSATDRDYNLAQQFCFDNLDRVSVVSGSHNEDSVKLLAGLMREAGLPNNHPHVYFSQLFGMSDNLSYVLAAEGYNVSKYVPYGPVKDALPYLIRRAKENTAVMGQMSRELEMIDREIKRRRQSSVGSQQLAVKSPD